MPQEKKVKKAALGIVRTKLCNMLTCFVNINAHPSIQHTMINSRVTGTIANNDEETTLYLISVICNFIITNISLRKI